MRVRAWAWRPARRCGPSTPRSLFAAASSDLKNMASSIAIPTISRRWRISIGPSVPGIRGALAAAARGDVRVDDRAVFADGPIDRSRRRAGSAVRGAVVVIEHAGHVVAGLLVRWDSSVCEHRFLARVVRRQRQRQIIPEALDQPTKMPNA